MCVHERSIVEMSVLLYSDITIWRKSLTRVVHAGWNNYICFKRNTLTPFSDFHVFDQLKNIFWQSLSKYPKRSCSNSSQSYWLFRYLDLCNPLQGYVILSCKVPSDDEMSQLRHFWWVGQDKILNPSRGIFCCCWLSIKRKIILGILNLGHLLYLLLDFVIIIK